MAKIEKSVAYSRLNFIYKVEMLQYFVALLDLKDLKSLK